MEISSLKHESLFIDLYGSFSFIIKLQQSGQIWLFNCFEGCQHILVRKKVKISQISKIILTNSYISNISGLLGLLSSISLITNVNTIDVYGPKGIQKYIFFCRKYSQTNFRYKLNVYTISGGFVIKQSSISMYTFINDYRCSSLNYFLLISEQPGFFYVSNAVKYNIPFGPLYGQLKQRVDFILPDGFILNSYNFIYSYYLGMKVIVFDTVFNRSTIEIFKNSVYL